MREWLASAIKRTTTLRFFEILREFKQQFKHDLDLAKKDVLDPV